MHAAGMKTLLACLTLHVAVSLLIWSSFNASPHLPNTKAGLQLSISCSLKWWQKSNTSAAQAATFCKINMQRWS